MEKSIESKQFFLKELETRDLVHPKVSINIGRNTHEVVAGFDEWAYKGEFIRSNKEKTE